MLKPGDSFERYTIEAPIGQGGMGSVYRALDTRLGRRVALKVISDRAAGEEANARLLREARAAAAIDHPNAVAIFDVGELDGAPYIVMELVEGRTLRGLVGDAVVPVATRIGYLEGAARALAGAHRRGLVHRDVKPENIMVREDGMVKVLDFGIARRTREGVDTSASTQLQRGAAATPPALATLTVDGVKLGTPVYMAPEQIRGDALDGRADQFSWGVLAFELLTGRLPWRGGADALAVMASILTDAPERAALERAGVPRAVQDVVLRALEKRPEDRFASLDDAVRALDAAARGEAPATGATMAQQFSSGEVREVLARAVEQQAKRQGTTKLGFEDLLAVAAEAGVDEGSLREASRALRARGQEPRAEVERARDQDPRTDAERARERDAWIRGQRRMFHRHAGIYVIINFALLALGVLLHRFTPFWVWVIPALAWGVGLAIHGLMALTANEDDWEEHDRGMQWWMEARRRRHELKMAAMEARGEGRRRRIEAPPRRVAPELEPRLRVAADTGRERAAEEEAAADEAREQRRGRR